MLQNGNQSEMVHSQTNTYHSLFNRRVHCPDTCEPAERAPKGNKKVNNLRQ